MNSRKLNIEGLEICVIQSFSFLSYQTFFFKIISLAFPAVEKVSNFQFSLPLLKDHQLERLMLPLPLSSYLLPDLLNISIIYIYYLFIE